MKKIIVLGAGMVGRAIAWELSADYAVHSVDFNSKNLAKLRGQRTITPHQADLNDSATIASLLTDADLAIGAVPGYMGYAVLSNMLTAGIPIVDISFFPEDALQLDTTAKQHGVTAVVDCGVAPGLSNMLLGRQHAQSPVSSFKCMVGGLPVERTIPFQYKAPFSPIDVIEEYTRPARLVRNGQEVILPALTELERIEFSPVGTLEAFNTDGLRSLIHSYPEIPDLCEKTLRYPGHIQLIQQLIAGGFFKTAPVTVNDQTVSPLDFTAQLLIDQWQLGETEREFTAMRAEITRDQQEKAAVFELFDEYDDTTGFSSMARTTGYTCAATARLLLETDYTRPGIVPPERIGEDESAYTTVMNQLAKHGIAWQKRA